MTYTGSKRPAGYVPLKVLAQAMRADIAQLIKDGKLPGKRSDYSVRVDNSGWTGSINITWKDTNHWVIEKDMWGDDSECLDELGSKVHDALQQVHRDYNYDASDAQVDYFNVGYYGGVYVMNAANTYPVRPMGRRYAA